MRFTIRDLLWLTVVVALAVAWYIDRSQLAKRLHRLEIEQIARTAIIEFDRIWSSGGTADYKEPSIR